MEPTDAETVAACVDPNHWWRVLVSGRLATRLGSVDDEAGSGAGVRDAFDTCHGTPGADFPWCTVASSMGHRGHARHSRAAIELPEVSQAPRSAGQGEGCHCLERT